MTKPEIAAKEPVGLELDPEQSYLWCACGKSKDQPFCDFTHKGTSIMPVRFSPDEKGEAWLCQCKQTKNPPYCDGSHNDL